MGQGDSEMSLFGIVGNKPKVAILIGIFILILCGLFWRCSKAAEVDLRTGTSFGPGGSGPVLGLDMKFPVGNNVDIFAGPTLWGATSVVANNWDMHLGARTCRWNICASLGAAYFGRSDSIDGQQLNFYLGLSWAIGWHRLSEFAYEHRSDAGVSLKNSGRNAAVIAIRLQ